MREAKALAIRLSLNAQNCDRLQYILINLFGLFVLMIVFIW